MSYEIFGQRVFESHPPCQEVIGSTGERLHRCGMPAVALLWHGRMESPYFMCQFDATHNLDNRGAVLILAKAGHFGA